MDMSDNEEIMRSLGRLEGQMAALQETAKNTAEKVDTMDSRLRTVESRTIRNGLLSGTLAGGVMALVTALAKAKLGA